MDSAMDDMVLQDGICMMPASQGTYHGAYRQSSQEETHDQGAYRGGRAAHLL